jgi:hypothetical protein
MLLLLSTLSRQLSAKTVYAGKHYYSDGINLPSFELRQGKQDHLDF